jgi:transposase
MGGCKPTNLITPNCSTLDAGQASSHSEGRQESLNRAAIAACSASAPTAIERRRWQVIGLLVDGAKLTEIVAVTGYRPRTIREIAQRYRERGPAGLVDGRQRSVGAAPILSKELQHDLHQALQNPAPDGGVWTGPKVARWIAARTGKHVHRQRGWEYLRRLISPAVLPGEDAEDVRV